MSQYSLYLYLSPFALIAAVVTTILVFQARRTLQNTALGIYLIGTVGYLITNLAELTSPTVAGTLLAAKLEYFFLATVPLAWLVFLFEFIGAHRWLSWRRFWIFVPIFIITFIVALTNDRTGLLWANYTFTPIGIDDMHVLQVISYGPWFWVFFIFGYIIQTIGITAIFWTRRRLPRIYRQQSAWVSAGTVFPLLVNLIYVFHLIPGWTKDYSPLAFAIAGLFFARGILRFGLLDLVPIARATLVESMADGLVVVDPLSQVVDINPAAQSMLNRTGETLIGQSVARVLPFWNNQPTQPLGADAQVQFEVTLMKNDQTRHYEVRILRLGRQKGQPVGTLVTLHEITQTKQLMVQLEDLAKTDHLTGLHNRRSILEMTQRELDRARRYSLHLSLILVDLDDLKTINDKHGHQAGDLVLQTVSNELRTGLRKVDIVARFGGDEFLILLPETNLNQAYSVAERLRQLIGTQPVDYKNAVIQPTCSMGVSTYLTDQNTTVDGLLESADHAMYRSKSLGRNQVTMQEIGS